MPNVYQLAAGYRKRLLEREKAASSQLLSAYERLLARVDAELVALTKAVREQNISASKLFSFERYKSFRRQIEIQMQRVVQAAANICESSQHSNALAAIMDSSNLIDAVVGMPIGSRLPASSIESFVGVAGDGSPLAEIFKTLAPQSVETVKDKLFEGIALGCNPRRVAVSSEHCACCCCCAKLLPYSSINGLPYYLNKLGEITFSGI